MTCSPFAIACQEWPDLNLLALTGKRPVETNWSRWCSQPQAPGYRHRWAKSSIAYDVGVALGFNGLLAIDVDTDAAMHIRAIISALPPIRAAKRGRRGFTAFFRDPTGKVPTARFKIVEILARGTQTVLPPSVHPDTGQPYIWLDPEALSVFEFVTLDRAPRLDRLPTLGPADAERLRSITDRILGRTEHNRRPQRSPVAPLLDEHERQRRYAEAILMRESAALGAMARNSGRNRAAFDLVCRVGRWVHAGIISADILFTSVREACWENGLISEDGISAVLATIASGLRRSANDALPDLHGGGHVDG